MKYLFIILGLCVFSNLSLAQSPLDNRIDFEVKQLSLAETLIKLGTEAGIPISFSDNILPKKKRITLQVRQQKVSKILSQILDKTDIQFKSVGAQVVLFYKKRPKEYFTISGFVEDKETGEKLIAANIFDKITGKGTSTNEYGFFSLKISAGKIALTASYLGYNSMVKNFVLAKKTKLQFSLIPNLTLQEIVVTASDVESLEVAGGLSTEQISIALMNKLPSVGGEVDLFRMLELSPGVQSGADGLGGLHVRGGSVDQNLILMDGVPIYNPSHSLGILSIFNTKAIQSVQFYKGAFPARYGGRLSSIMDVRTREGNKKRWTGEVKAGMVASTVRIEGPIIKDKMSILVTARRTLLDKFIQNQTRKIKEKLPEIKEIYGVALQGYSNYHFYDLNGKINYSLSEKDKFYLSYYRGSDEFHDEDFIEDAPFDGYQYSDIKILDYDWGNSVGVFRWNHLFKNNLFLNTTLTQSIFKFQSEESLEIDIVFDATSPPFYFFVAEAYRSTLKDLGGRLDFDYNFSKNHHLRFGVNSTLHTFQPGAFGGNVKVDDEVLYEVDIDSFLNATQVSALDYNLYFEDEFLVGKKTTLNLGVLGNMFDTGEKIFFFIQPRFLLNYQITSKLSLQTALSKMVQPLHLITGSDAGFPNDLWLPATKLIPPQTSWQGVIGLKYQPKKSYHFSIEGYYKKMDNLVVYIDGSSLEASISNPSNFTFTPINTENWESQVTTGEGWNYGLEFQFKKNIGRTTGTINYSWAFANRQFEEINSGEKFPYRYDRRHNINIAINHRFAKWLDISCNWIFGSGLSVLIPVSTYQLGGITLLNYDFARMPANHRLDAGFNFYFKTWKLDHKIYLGAYNIYNRSNPQYYQLKTVPKENPSPGEAEFDYKIYESSFLPFLPSVSYSISF